MSIFLCQMEAFVFSYPTWTNLKRVALISQKANKLLALTQYIHLSFSKNIEIRRNTWVYFCAKWRLLCLVSFKILFLQQTGKKCSWAPYHIICGIFSVLHYDFEYKQTCLLYNNCKNLFHLALDFKGTED